MIRSHSGSSGACCTRTSSTVSPFCFMDSSSESTMIKWGEVVGCRRFAVSTINSPKASLAEFLRNSGCWLATKLAKPGICAWRQRIRKDLGYGYSFACRNKSLRRQADFAPTRPRSHFSRFPLRQPRPAHVVGWYSTIRRVPPAASVDQ